MRILHIIPTYLPSINSRGVIDSMHFLNKELVKKGVGVVVYTTNQDGAGGSMDVPIGKEVDVDGVKVLYFKSSFLKNWYYSGEMRKAISENVANFDVVHITSVFLAQSTLGGYYARKFNKPYIITPHGSLMKVPLLMNTFVKKLYILLLEKRNLADANLHFMTELEKEQFLETKFPFKRTFVVSNAVEAKNGLISRSKEAFKKRLGISQSAQIILFLGRLAKIKGFDTLIPAFKRVVEKRPETILVIAGPDAGDYLKDIEKLILKHQLKDKIIVAGTLLGQEKSEAYIGSDIFVAPSYSENFGMSIAEAMSFGLPVVLTEGVGISLAVNRAGAGVVVKKEERDLANGMIKLLGEPRLASQMGEAAKNMARKEFSPEFIAEKFIAEYNNSKQSY